MQLQFERQGIPCLKTLKREIQSQEQTQEVRISDGMPDIGSIIGAWGQVILRGKEWQSDAMSISGGTMVWVQYMPEEGGEPQSLESWLPFQMQWPLPETQYDGDILAQCILRSVDARSLSARKLMIRTNVSVLGMAMEKQEQMRCVPKDVPEDIQLRIRHYPMQLPVEAGEKAFTIEESLVLPPSAPKMEKLILYTLQPEITEERLMSDKLVFRGNGMLHVLYVGEDGGQYTWDFDLPFTQYCELDSEYADTSEIMIWPCVTALEVEKAEDQLQIKAGLVCQYRICSLSVVEAVEDAYSVRRSVNPAWQELELPGVLENKTQTISVQQSSSLDGMRLVQTQFLPQPVQVQMAENESSLLLSGQFQMLYHDMDGNMRTASQKWEEKLSIPTGEGTLINAQLWPAGKTQGTIMSGAVQLTSELKLTMETHCSKGIPMITELELGELQQPDPHRPSLILKRAAGKSLWELAKENGSTVTVIEQANGLETEPEENRMLLIPVI